MRNMTPEILASLRERFPQGTRGELLRLDDLQAPPAGTMGTVIWVDDSGSIMVRWDTGGSLNVLYGVDECRKVGE